MGGAICGGVISETQFRQDLDLTKGMAYMMSYVMPDKQYKQYVALLKAKKDKEAQKLFTRYAISQI